MVSCVFQLWPDELYKWRRKIIKMRNGIESCFVDPSGDIIACNGMDRKISMGNIREKGFDEIWNSREAEDIRSMVNVCQRQCWMVGSAAPAIKKHPYKPLIWIFKNKLRVMLDKAPVLCLPDKE